MRLPSQVRDADSKPLNPSATPDVWVTVAVMNSPALSRTTQVALTKVASVELAAALRSKQAGLVLLPLVAMATVRTPAAFPLNPIEAWAR